MLSGELTPDKGKITHATGLRTAYFKQHREQLNPEWTLRRALVESGDAVVFRGQSMHVVGWAARFQFRPGQLDTQVKDLSGGEQARLAIARLMLLPADVLLLDEPTNDLDIPALEVLEENLLDFPGAIAIVSHDRYLLSRVCNRFLGLDGGGGAASYGDYLQWETDLKRVKSGTPAASQEQKEKGPRRNRSQSCPIWSSGNSIRLKNEYSPQKKLQRSAKRTFTIRGSPPTTKN